MRKLLLFLLVSIALPALAQNGKKVYADFHGVRYTRQHDGKLGVGKCMPIRKNQVPEGSRCVIMPI